MLDGNRDARRERPAIVEADIAAFEMILQQAEIFGFHVLQHTQCFHAEVHSIVHGRCYGTSAARKKHI